MSAATSTRTRLSRLLGEVRHEREAIERQADEVKSLAPKLQRQPDRASLALIAVDLHGYYTALETLFERVARAIDGEVPVGIESHRELVEQMAADIPPLRPAVISTGTRGWLHVLRSFRHFFRHAYAVDLDPQRLSEHSDALLERHPTLCDELDAFLAFVERTRDALPAE